ncbi:MAG TPA: hypothetical protein PK781_11215, partial [Terrimesophilobacter sp.]|nr:hypothetical protein [Terrimesophilobacter sp.]
VDADDAVPAAIELATRLAVQPREALLAARRLLRGDREHLLDVIDAEVEVFVERLASSETRNILDALQNRKR